MTRSARVLILAFALLGLSASGAATYIHYQLLHDPTYQSACDINTTVSCTQVYLSRYGSLWGMPVAMLGTLWFALVTLLVVSAGRASDGVQQNVVGYVFALSTLGLAAVFYLGYASFAVLKVFCIFCGITYVAVVGIFLVSGAATAFPMTTIPGRLGRDVKTLLRTPAALMLALLFAAGAAASLTVFPTEESHPAELPAPESPATSADATTASDETSEFERWYDALPRVALPVPQEDATVLVVKFNDYQCPPCRKSYFDYKPVFEKYRDRGVRFVTRDFPLDPECNSSLQRSLHDAACEAAVAVRLARARGNAERLEQWLFENQESMTPEAVRNGAATVAGVTDFDSAYARTLDAVRADIALGLKFGVGSTPTFFINGAALPAGALPPQYMDQAIAYELRKAGK